MAIFNDSKSAYVTMNLGEAARASGIAPSAAALSDLNAANIAKFLQETLDEADSEVQTIGRSIAIKGSLPEFSPMVERLTARRAKYIKMRSLADHLLNQPESVIVALLRGKPVTRTSIRALCEVGGGL